MKAFVFITFLLAIFADSLGWNSNRWNQNQWNSNQYNPNPQYDNPNQYGYGNQYGYQNQPMMDSSNQQCSQYEIFQQCMGMEPTCQNPNPSSSGMMMNMMCRPGCQCMQGYVRDTVGSGQCINRLQCPQY